jgi:hypothetical protein
VIIILRVSPEDTLSIPSTSSLVIFHCGQSRLKGCPPILSPNIYQQRNSLVKSFQQGFSHFDLGHHGGWDFRFEDSASTRAMNGPRLRVSKALLGHANAASSGRICIRRMVNLPIKPPLTAGVSRKCPNISSGDILDQQVKSNATLVFILEPRRRPLKRLPQ